LGCLNVIIDSDIIFLLVSILKPHYFNLLKTALKWRVFISQEIEEEIADPVSSSLKEKLLREGIWEYFSPSDLQQEKEIMRKYNDLRKIIHKGEASCYAIAYCAGFSVLSHDHEANRLLPPEFKEKVKWYSFYEMLYLLNRETAISDQEAEECIRSLGQVLNFTLPAAIRERGFSAIKQIFDKKYPAKILPGKSKKGLPSK
jgi:predicted nucleic acid-binding protein